MARTKSRGARLIGRFALSLAFALLLAFGVPILLNAFAVPALTAAVGGALLGSTALVAALLVGIGIVGALVGAPLGYLGEPDFPGRGRTAALFGVVGALAAYSTVFNIGLAPNVAAVIPGGAAFGALALMLPLLAAIGAAVGAITGISRGTLAVARYISAHYSLVVVTAAIAGGWLGLLAAQGALATVFQTANIPPALAGCGLIIGVALGMMLAAPIGYVVRRFAWA